MPHKRAKRSVRVQERSAKGSDHAPGGQSLENEAIPKSLARVLNAAGVREQYSKKRKAEDDGEQKNGKAKGKRRKMEEEKAAAAAKIQPGESLQHFNKRVEQDMRHLVKNAVQSSLATTRKAKADEIEKKKEKKKQAAAPERTPSPSPPPSPPPKHWDRPKEFEQLSTSAPRRLNDIAQAPPELRLKKAAKVSAIGDGRKNAGVLSMAQKAMMEEEREKAIARYRQLKAERRGEAES